MLAHGAPVGAADVLPLIAVVAASAIVAASDATTRRSGDAPGGSGRVAPPPAVATAAWLVGAQLIHWGVIAEHAAEWPSAGWFFFLLAAAEGACAIAALARPGRATSQAVVVVSVVPIVVWVVDRSVGLPFGPTAGVRGEIGRLDAVVVLFEVMAAVSVWTTVRARRETRTEHLRVGLAVTTCLWVATVAMWAGLGAGSDDHVETVAVDAAANTSTAPTAE